jgi:hypothetical protein
MLNEDVIDLYSRVNVGTKVVVLPMPARGQIAASQDQSIPRATGSAVATVVRARGIY